MALELGPQNWGASERCGPDGLYGVISYYSRKCET